MCEKYKERLRTKGLKTATFGKVNTEMLPDSFYPLLAYLSFTPTAVCERGATETVTQKLTAVVV